MLHNLANAYTVWTKFAFSQLYVHSHSINVAYTEFGKDAHFSQNVCGCAIFDITS